MTWSSEGLATSARRLVPGDAWARGQRATGTAPQGAAFAEICLKSAHDSGTVWFDDVEWAQTA